MATSDQIRRRGRWSLAVGMLIAALMLVAVAYADNVQNDVTVGGNDTFIAGGSTTINYRIIANNGDGQTGCNPSDGSAATVTINAPVSVTATPGSRVFTSCGANQSVVFTSTSPGDYNVTVSVADSGAGTYNTTPARFTLHVLAPSDSSPPVITPNVSGTLGTNGWYVSDVTVSWNVVDNESVISSSSGCGSTIISADTPGTTLTCTATSTGGTSSQSVTIKRDATAPSISGSASPAPNGNGWSNSDVTVSFTCGDALSGIASCESPHVLSSEGAGQSATGYATDNAGNTANTTVAEINIDKTAPTATATPAPAANVNGWNNSDVTVSFSGTDALSGIDFCDSPVVLSSDGAGQSASGTCTDKAGNVSDPATASGINIDKTAPSVALVGGPADGASYYFGSVPAAPTCTASDALSGLDGACMVSGFGTAVGSHTVTGSVTDKAGNSASDAHTYSVLAWTLNGFFQPVDMGASVWNTVKGGSTIPLKFRVFAGSTELTDTSVVTLLKAAQVPCSSGSEDTIEELAPTGGTSLRYDSTGAQFIYNWQTPKKPGYCYRVTVGTADGSSLVANFKLK
jgi:hypothetical protein